MHKHLIVLSTLLIGCLPVARGADSSSSGGRAKAVLAVEPGMLELDTVRADDGSWRLVIAAGAQTLGDPPPARVALTKQGEADRWRKLYVWKQFHDGITWLGGGRVGRETGELHERSARELDELPVIAGPGAYTLKIDLGGSVSAFSVSVVEIRQTTGELGLAIDSRDYKDRAAIRFDRDVHGIDIGYPHEPRLWLTLRTPMTRATTRADVLWYRGAESAGHSEHVQRLGGIGLATPYERPTRFWSWPKDLHLAEMADGKWTAYVYQDGVYTTACTFHVAGGDIVGRGKSSVVLVCGRQETPFEVKRRGAMLPIIAEDPHRKQELIALWRSEETRDLLAELILARRAQGDAMFSRGVAASAEEEAWTKRQAALAAARYERAHAEVKVSSKLVGELTRRYQGLVAKHGRE